MRKFLLFLVFISIGAAWAQDATEEAIILNQELQFLEESAKGTKTTDLEGSAIMRKRKVIEQSLERTYFGEDQEDTVSTRTAARKRRQAK